MARATPAAWREWLPVAEETFWIRIEGFERWLLMWRPPDPTSEGFERPFSMISWTESPAARQGIMSREAGKRKSFPWRKERPRISWIPSCPAQEEWYDQPFACRTYVAARMSMSRPRCSV